MTKTYAPMQWLTSCVSITLVLTLLGTVVLFGLTAHKLSRDVRENLVVTLLLSDDVSTAQADSLAAELTTRPYAAAVSVISSEQALAEEMARLGTDPTEFLGGENPYTATIEMNVRADYACTDSLLPLQQELRHLWQVTDVVYQQELVDGLNHLLQTATLVLMALAALLIVVSVVLINNTVRLSVYSRRFTIHTMRLVGASWGFIRRPFMLRSLGIGLTAAAVAIGVLAAGTWWIRQQDPYMASLLTRDVTIPVALAVVAAAIALTGISTWLSVGRFLHMREAEMYK